MLKKKKKKELPKKKIWKMFCDQIYEMGKDCVEESSCPTIHAYKMITIVSELFMDDKKSKD
jgi:hypothetical protein